MALNDRILLLGSMGAGKTTIGTELSQILGWPYIDNDDELSVITGFSREELSQLPIPQLHEYESQYLHRLAAKPGPFIAGAAGSVVDYEGNYADIESMFSVYLFIPLETIYQRVGDSGVGRQIYSPNSTTENHDEIAKGREILRERFERRDPLYRKLSKLTVELSSDPHADTLQILEALKQR
jgi:shikimate kinase/3-dehydroquinate synthase